MSIFNIGFKAIISISMEQFVTEINEFKRTLMRTMEMEGAISLIIIN